MLSFNCELLIELLRKRGIALSKLDFVKVKEVDDLIVAATKDWDKYTTPCYAIFTF